MVLYFCVLIVFSLRCESLKLILDDEPLPKDILSQLVTRASLRQHIHVPKNHNYALSGGSFSPHRDYSSFLRWQANIFSIWCRGRWGNLWCDSWFHCRGTCSIEVSVCMDLDHTLGHDSKLRPAGCIGGTFGQKCLGFFPAKALRSSSASSLAAHDYQSRCCAHVLGNCADYHYNRVLELHLILKLFSAVQVCGNAGPPTC
jgi:hypothetical protein